VTGVSAVSFSASRVTATINSSDIPLPTSAGAVELQGGDEAMTEVGKSVLDAKGEVVVRQTAK
jgi:hypothetical protein